MTDYLDTSIIIGYLSQDPPERGRLASALIDSNQRLHLSVVALSETAFVLERTLRVPREEVVDSLMHFVRLDNITVVDVDSNYLHEALMMCRPSRRVSFADALIWAVARSRGGRSIYSFDRRFPKDSIHLIEPT